MGEGEGGGIKATRHRGKKGEGVERHRGSEVERKEGDGKEEMMTGEGREIKKYKNVANDIDYSRSFQDFT